MGAPSGTRSGTRSETPIEQIEIKSRARAGTQARAQSGTRRRTLAATNGAPRARRVLAGLARLYPEVRSALDFENPFQLLLATILSAQCTDRTVNQVTPALFARWPSPRDYAGLDEEELGRAIRHLGLWRTKARNIIAACRLLTDRFAGEVPRSRAELLTLPGVGRKTANVVLANAFGVPALAVDTHVLRVANRLGLARARTPEETERQLCARVPRRLWIATHHRLIWHGRLVCRALRPRCGECPLRPDCPTGRRTREPLPAARRRSKQGADAARGRTS